jgi:hypothetical protein
MEPQLIEPNVLKKLYKKRLELNNKNFFSDIISNVWLFVKRNWIGIAIILFVISLFVYFYLDRQKNEFNNIPEIKIKEEPEEENMLHGGYEAEYYKMLPRVMPPPPEAYDEEYDYDYQ